VQLNHYSLWKNLLVVAVFAAGALFALPNVYGDDPAVQVAHPSLQSDPTALAAQVEAALSAQGIRARASGVEDGQYIVRFTDTDTQLKAVDVLAATLGPDYGVALNLAPRTPQWLRDLGLKPMNLGLDLRGGVHFLLEVDMDAAIAQAVERYEGDLRTLLRDKQIRYLAVGRDGASVTARFRAAADRDAASEQVALQFPELTRTALTTVEGEVLQLTLSDQRRRDIRDAAVQQNITTLRNRVNELGVAEPIVQRQGLERIVVQLPGVQDTVRAKEILGATATLEFRLVETTGDPVEAQRSGRVPLGSRLYKDRDGQPVLLKREVIVTGDQLNDASSGFDSQSGEPAVFVNLDATGARRMGETTAKNINKPMAVVFIENKTRTTLVDGQPVRTKQRVEEVINIATIRGVFSNRFQITGVDPEEGRNLALLLRAGALAAPVDVVEQRTIGPSLGKDNITMGFKAAVVGFLLSVAFVVTYYRVFGLIAALGLTMNLVLVIALMSLIQATLTLPGIAGIVLTVGMAVDANVLIYERIREELRKGTTPQAAIHAGYERAFITIADSNITTLIAGIVLFGLGSGPIKGFAVTLTLGILTSMFTAVMGTRALANLIYGGRKSVRLSI
jgi:preprotein translocase subunit SecD